MCWRNSLFEILVILSWDRHPKRMLFFLLKGLGFHLKFNQKLHLKGGNKLWWPVRTNGDTSERKCAIVFGSASATYPLTRDSYGQPWLTVWLQNSGFFHLTASTADQAVTFHLWSVFLFYISTCVYELVFQCVWLVISRSHHQQVSSPTTISDELDWDSSNEAPGV